MGAPGTIDYDALARQAGAISGRPPSANPAGGSVDYEALAKQSGAVSSFPTPEVPPQTVGHFLHDAVVDTITGLYESAKRVVSGPKSKGDVAASLAGPLGLLLKDIAASHAETAHRALEAYKEGRYTEAAGYAGGAVLPVVGPWAASIGDKIGSGDIAGGLGDLTAGLLAPEAARRIPKIRILPKNKIASSLTPEEAAAVKFADESNIPISAATRTGNRAVRNVQAFVGNQVGGAGVAKEATEATRGALKRVGGELAEEVSPEAATAETAGAAVRGELTAQQTAKQAGITEEGNRVLAQSAPRPATPEEAGAGLRSQLTARQAAKQAGIAGEGNRVLAQTAPTAATPEEAGAGVASTLAARRASQAAEASDAYARLEEIEGRPEHRKKVEVKGRAQEGPQQLIAVRPPEEAPAPGAPVTEVPNAEATTAASREVGQGPAVSETPGRSMAVEAGTDTRVRVPGEGRSYRARYEVRELGEVKASHSGESFQPNPRYELTNDRDYTQRENQGKIITWSGPEFDASYHITDNPDATNGPVIIDSKGNAIGGNGRTMILERVYQYNQKGAQSYRDMLRKKAPQFGVDPAAVDKMQRPVLVRVIDDSEFQRPSAKQGAVTDLNKVGTAALRPSERAIADSRRVSAGTLEDLADRLDAKGPEASIAQILEGKSGTEVLDNLIGDGVISPQERAAYAKGNELTPDGKTRISRLVVGRFFRDPAQLDSIPQPIVNKLERIAAPLSKIEGLANWNLTPTVQGAVDLIENARAHSMSLDKFLAQGTLLGPSYTAQEITLAQHLLSTSGNELAKGARKYAAEAGYANEGAGLFGGETPLGGPAPVPSDIFREVFGAEAMPPTFSQGASPAAPVSAEPVRSHTAETAAPAGGAAAAGGSTTGQIGEAGQPAPAPAPLATNAGDRARTPPPAATKELALPVDMRPWKKELQPLYDRLKQELPVSQQQSSRALHAIEQIVNGEDHVAASVAESNLGAIKTIQRDAVNGRTKFLAGKLIDRLEPTVDAVVGSAGEEALTALKQGRALTRAKYATQATIDELHTEPVKLFRQLTASGDAGINLLRDVAEKAGDAMPALGRAALEGALDKPAEWAKLGDATKKVLYPNPLLRENIDTFFKRVAEAATDVTLDQLHTEPVKLFRQLTASGDAAIDILRDVAAKAPNAMPALGRAALEGAIEKPGEWSKLGDQTKKILYPDPALREKIDAFFKRAAEGATDVTLDQLQTEPVKVFNQLTTQKDTAINLLREVSARAPKQMGQVARARAEGLIERATSGDRGAAEAAYNDWKRMGPESKKIFFPDAGLRSKLDSYFTLAKKFAEDPNTSGTSYVTGAGAHVATFASNLGLLITHPSLGIAGIAGQATYLIGNHALARILYSPRGIATLNKGLTVKVGDKLAAAAAAGNILKAVGKDAKVIQFPAAAQQQSPEQARQ